MMAGKQSGALMLKTACCALKPMNADNVNVERIVRDAAGNELRRIELDAAGQELGKGSVGPVRWASMDGTEEGLAEKGQEKLGD
jgi:hypothetical protein